MGYHWREEWVVVVRWADALLQLGLYASMNVESARRADSETVRAVYRGRAQGLRTAQNIMAAAVPRARRCEMGQ